MQQIPEIVKSKAVVVGAWNNMTRYSGYYDWWIPGTREHCEISGFDSALLNKFVNLKIKPDIYIFNACVYNKNSKHILPRYFFSLNEWQNHEGENTIHSFKEHINLFNDYTTVVNKIYKTDFLKHYHLEQ